MKKFLKVLVWIMVVLLLAVIGAGVWLQQAADTPEPADPVEEAAYRPVPFDPAAFFNEQKPAFSEPVASAVAVVTSLRTEDLDSPLGLDEPQPRFSWQLQSPDRGVQQTAYQLRVQQGDQLVWDSGWVDSGQSYLVAYAGAPLQPRSAYQWQVNVRLNSGEETGWSSPARWDTGLMGQPWLGQWIDPEGDINVDEMQPAPYLRKELVLAQAPAQARLYISAKGLYEAYINGQRVGEQVFAPGSTEYRQRIQYQAFDVTQLLQPGANALGAILGDGWFRGGMGIDGVRNNFGTRLALIAELHVSYADGSSEVITSDDSWKATSEGPIRRGDMIRLEDYDARREMPGWASVGFDDSSWHAVTVVNTGSDADTSVLVDTIAPLSYEHETFTPRVLHTPNGETVLDFGQNIAGYVAFSIAGPAGHTVTLRHGETLDAEGNFTVDHLVKDRALQTVGETWQQTRYTLKGEGRENYKPRFNINGFRYVRLDNWPEAVVAEHFKAIAVYSGLDAAGFFESSNPLVNRFVLNSLWSQKGNFLDVPTDCPQRERAGWTGDAQAYFPTSTLYMNVAPFFSKWLEDLAVAQREDGVVPNIVPGLKVSEDGPEAGMDLNGSAGWGDAAVIIPWQHFRHYGDRRVLEKAWPMMKGWVDYQAEQAKKNNPFRIFRYLSSDGKDQPYVWDTGFHWGEWLEPGRNDLAQIMATQILGTNDVPTAYFAYSSRLLASAADVLGKHDDAARYRELADKARAAYVATFTDEGVIDSHWQARYVRPVALGLLNPSQADKAMSDLVALIKANDYQIGTGFLSTPFVLSLLSDYGYHNVAWKMLTQERAPGWMYQVTRGATAIAEKWKPVEYNGELADGSMNHYAFGAASRWLFNKVAGIELGDAQDAYQHFVLRPRLIDDLQYARAQLHSPYGLIESRWQKTDDAVAYEFTVPANTVVVATVAAHASAAIVEAGVPLAEVEGVSDIREGDGEVSFALGSGRYRFVVHHL